MEKLQDMKWICRCVWTFKLSPFFFFEVKWFLTLIIIYFYSFLNHSVWKQHWSYCGHGTREQTQHCRDSCYFWRVRRSLRLRQLPAAEGWQWNLRFGHVPPQQQDAGLTHTARVARHARVRRWIRRNVWNWAIGRSTVHARLPWSQVSTTHSDSSRSAEYTVPACPSQRQPVRSGGVLCWKRGRWPSQAELVHCKPSECWTNLRFFFISCCNPSKVEWWKFNVVDHKALLARIQIYS